MREIYPFVSKNAGGADMLSWGCAAAPNTVLRVICYLILAAVTLGGAIADIWGMIQSIRDGV